MTLNQQAENIIVVVVTAAVAAVVAAVVAARAPRLAAKSRRSGHGTSLRVCVMMSGKKRMIFVTSCVRKMKQRLNSLKSATTTLPKNSTTSKSNTTVTRWQRRKCLLLIMIRLRLLPAMSSASRTRSRQI